MPDPIYLDYNSTTPVDPRVVEAMLPFFSTHFGNASSKSHSFGWYSEAAVERSRKLLGQSIGFSDDSLTFSSGATEAINLGLRGIAVSLASRGKHIVTSNAEHSAVFETCKILENYGFRVSYVDLDSLGAVRVEDVLEAIDDDTTMVSIMWANNETGVINPIETIAEEIAAKDVLLMSDATQMMGKSPLKTGNVDVLVGSAHKFYGPKGVGFLALSEQVSKLATQISGGGQERGMRGGTLNTPGIVGMGKAVELLNECMEEEVERLKGYRDVFEKRLHAELENISINGERSERLPQTSNICFKGVRTDKLLRELRGVAASPGSACSSGSAEPSRVLLSMGLSREDALSSVRFSLGRFTTEEDLEQAIEQIIAAVRKSRK